MPRISPLAWEFLEKYPIDSVRILEKFPASNISSLLASLEPEVAARILECMVLHQGAECLMHSEIEMAVKFLKEMKLSNAARLLRAMDQEASLRTVNALPVHLRNSIQSVTRYPEDTAGTLMDSNPFHLPSSVSAGNAIRRLRQSGNNSVCELFVIDDNHKLSGSVRVADLFYAPRSLPLQTLMMHDMPFVYTRTPLLTAVSHKGWRTFSTLPVVEQDHTFTGILKYHVLIDALAEIQKKKRSDDTFANMFTMAQMYWIVIGELIGSLSKHETNSDSKQ